MPAISLDRAKQLRFGSANPRVTTRCCRCGHQFREHDNLRCTSIGESTEHFQNFINTGIDDQITTRGPGHQITDEDAYVLRFGTSSINAANQSARCRRCGEQWGTHQDARCMGAGESNEHYLELLNSGIDDHEYPLVISGTFKTIKLGADPEFEIRDSSGKFVNAHNVVNAGTGADVKWGTDGNSSTGELRTDPGDPDVVLKSISSILDYGKKQLSSRYTVYAGAGKNVALGGHIHFSGVDADRRLITLLDTFIATPLRAITDCSKRDSTGYGKLGEYRNQPHGWEYRSPCSWISHPLIAQGVLNTAYELALAFQDDNSIKFDSKERFIAYVRENSDVSAKKIEAFYDIIDRMAAKKAKLEQVEVFQAWKKSPRPEVKPTPVKKVQYTWEMSHRNMPEIRELVDKRRTKHNTTATETVSIQVIGASKERTGDLIVYVPTDWVSKLPRRIAKIRVQEWELKEIGLSYELRLNVELASEILSFIKWYILNKSSIAQESVIQLIEEGEAVACAV